MEFLLIGVAVLFNLAVIKIKFDKHQYLNALVDAVILGGVTAVFSDSYGALVVGTIASAGFSIFLMVSPPKLLSKEQLEKMKAVIDERRA